MLGADTREDQRHQRSHDQAHAGAVEEQRPREPGDAAACADVPDGQPQAEQREHAHPGAQGEDLPPEARDRRAARTGPRRGEQEANADEA